jgi:hypothetical protein
MVTLFIADALIEGYGSDAELTRLADEMEWIFAPVVNVDVSTTRSRDDPAR